MPGLEPDLREQIARALYQRDHHEIGHADDPSWDDLDERSRQPHHWRAGTVYTQFVAPLLEDVETFREVQRALAVVTAEVVDLRASRFAWAAEADRLEQENDQIALDYARNDETVLADSQQVHKENERLRAKVELQAAEIARWRSTLPAADQDTGAAVPAARVVVLPEDWQTQIRTAPYVQPSAGAVRTMVALIESWCPTVETPTAPRIGTDEDPEFRRHAAHHEPQEGCAYCPPVSDSRIPTDTVQAGNATPDYNLRVWYRGAPQPDGVNHVRERGERHWILARTDNLWYLRDISGPTLLWSELLDRSGWVIEVALPAIRDGATS